MSTTSHKPDAPTPPPMRKRLREVLIDAAFKILTYELVTQGKQWVEALLR